MQTYTMKLVSFFALAVIFCSCKSSTEATNPNNASVVEVHTILDSVQKKFLEYADSTDGNPREAIERTVNYLFFQPNVKDVYSIDSTHIRITLASGLQTTFYFTETDAAGNSLYRGGGGGAVLKDLTPLATRTISNKKVLFFAADTKTLPAVNPQIQKGIEKINASGLDLEVTVLRDEQCTYGVVETFKDYGLVLIDTHGDIGNFQVGSTLDLSTLPSATEAAFKAATITQLSAAAYDKLLSGDLMLGAEIKGNPQDPNWHKSVIPSEGRTLHFTAKYVNLLPSMPNTIIMGNMCYSGTVADRYTMPRRIFVNDKGKIVVREERSQPLEAVGKAFIDKNPISYYAYTKDLPYPGTSRVVPDAFAASCEDRLIKRLISDKDSTGIAHTSYVLNEEVFDPEIPRQLVGDLYFRQYGHKDYSYSNCVSEFTDERDGQKYKAVCIGKQNWMAENLRFVTPASMFYNDSAELGPTYGRLYTWDDMMAGNSSSNNNPSGVKGICPKGWHIPSLKEWEQLNAFIGDSGANLKAITNWNPPNLGATDKYGFKAFGGGMYYPDSNTCYFLNQEGHWWASTITTDPKNSYYAILTTYTTDLFLAGITVGGTDRQKKSCRCVKD